jgi:diguanylate cyclase (GGDEF)-like protein
MKKEKRQSKERCMKAPDYGSFLKMLEKAMAKAEETKGCLSIALVDLDWFKKVNDEYGRKAGDAVIRTLVKHLARAVGAKGAIYRQSAIYRRGGEEFVLLLPALEKEQVFLLLEQARSSFDKEHVFSVDGSRVAVRVTFSGAIASYPDDGANPLDIVRKVEDTLHRAKTSGRNKICLAREDRMVTKTSHYTQGQLERLSQLAKGEDVGEAVLLREALDDLLRKHDI